MLLAATSLSVGFFVSAASSLAALMRGEKEDDGAADGLKSVWRALMLPKGCWEFGTSG